MRVEKIKELSVVQFLTVSEFIHIIIFHFPSDTVDGVIHASLLNSCSCLFCVGLRLHTNYQVVERSKKLWSNTKKYELGANG
jgi:hypothetical protein